MIDYAVYYMKAETAKNLKKFSHRKLNEADRNYTDKIKLKFKQQSTRKLYPGKHQLSLIINGVESERIDFNLKFS